MKLKVFPVMYLKNCNLHHWWLPRRTATTSSSRLLWLGRLRWQHRCLIVQKISRSLQILMSHQGQGKCWARM